VKTTNEDRKIRVDYVLFRVDKSCMIFVISSGLSKHRPRLLQLILGFLICRLNEDRSYEYWKEFRWEVFNLSSHSVVVGFKGLTLKTMASITFRLRYKW